jgi:hypothetical protein
MTDATISALISFESDKYFNILDIAVYSMVKLIDVSEEHTTSFFSVEE